MAHNTMDPLLVSLVSVFESTRKEGVPWPFNLILFSGGRRYVGTLLTQDEFLANTDKLLQMVAGGINSDESSGQAVDPSKQAETSCLHLTVSQIQDGDVVFNFEGLYLRFRLDRIEAWTTGAIETGEETWQ